ncbi:MAG: hypothetical protein ACU0DT_17465 [Albimonas sp.]|uniref:hypothetical protein n=1 Tax=Albimonas sp. TaxID=1872425 RepID=UPI004056A6B0|tara:strand:+ start:136 stop:465 length:330 start_codon:yes stop_codon:yes gene_type:complete
MRRAALALIGLMISSSPLAADGGCRMNIADYVGWQIIYHGALTGAVDLSGRSETFQGCTPGRVLLIDADRSVVCTQTRLGAGYRPDIVVLSDGREMVACIADQLYRVRN